MKVFISYSRHDYFVASSLRSRLLKVDDVDPWLDSFEIVPGADWAKAIDQALVGADALILVASKRSLSSPYVRDEVQRAVDHKVPIVIAVVSKCTLDAHLIGKPIYDLRSNLKTQVMLLAEDLVDGEFSHARTDRKQPTRFYRPPISVAFISAYFLIAIASLTCAAFFCKIVSDNTDHEAVLHFPPNIWFGPARNFQMTDGFAHALFAASLISAALISWRYVAFIRHGLRASSVFPASMATLTVTGLDAAYLYRTQIVNGEPSWGSPWIVVTVLAVSLAAFCAVMLTKSLSPFARHCMRVETEAYYVPTLESIRNPALSSYSKLCEAVRQWHSQFRKRRRFSVASDALDSSLADLMRQVCLDFGMRESRRADWHLRIVTKNTDVASLGRSRGGDKVIYVLGSSIEANTDGTLIRNNQWLDFREQDDESMYALARLIGLPSASRQLAFPIIPSTQRVVPHWADLHIQLSNLIGFLFMTFGLVAATGVAEGSPDSTSQTVLFLTLAVLHLKLGVQVQNRAISISLCRFQSIVFATAAGGVYTYAYLTHPLSVWPSVAFIFVSLAVVGIVSIAATRATKHWLPPASPRLALKNFSPPAKLVADVMLFILIAVPFYIALSAPV